MTEADLLQIFNHIRWCHWDPDLVSQLLWHHLVIPSLKACSISEENECLSSFEKYFLKKDLSLLEGSWHSWCVWCCNSACIKLSLTACESWCLNKNWGRYLFLKFGGFVGVHPVAFRAYSWLCIKALLLPGLMGPQRVVGIEPASAKCKAKTLSAVLLSWLWGSN